MAAVVKTKGKSKLPTIDGEKTFLWLPSNNFTEHVYFYMHIYIIQASLFDAIDN